MEISVSPAQLPDIDQMLVLLEELFSIEKDFDFDVSKCRNALKMLISGSDNGVVFAAKAADKLVGMCSVQALISTAHGGKSGVIEDMIVSRNSRREGVGSLLINKIEDWATELGIGRLQLLADITNTPALDFYERNRWSRTQLMCLRKHVRDV
jgi:GNAT superfamily N-acetyltransferase